MNKRNKMNTKINVLLLTILLLATACGKSDNVRIKGSFSGVPEMPVYLDLISTTNVITVDSTVTDNKGRFQFKATLREKQPTFYSLRSGNQSITLLLAPGDKVEIRSLGNLATNYLVEGSKGSQEVKEVNSLLIDSRRVLDSLSNLFATMPASVERSMVRGQYSREFIQQKRDLIAFVIGNATSLSAVYALYQQMPNGDPIFGDETDLPYYRLVADSLETRYPNSPHVRSLLADLDDVQRRIELNNMLAQADEASFGFPDIDMPDMYGNRIRLSSLVGKVILVDFWTANTAENRIVNAELAELYAEYKGRGLEIYQVSLDNNRAAWISAVQQQKIPWISVSDLNGLNSPAVRVYNIASVPANVLINRHGDIVARNVPVDRLQAEIRKLL